MGEVNDTEDCPKCGLPSVSPWNTECAVPRGTVTPSPAVYTNRFRCPNSACKHEWSTPMAPQPTERDG